MFFSGSDGGGVVLGRGIFLGEGVVRDVGFLVVFLVVCFGIVVVGCGFLVRKEGKVFDGGEGVAAGDALDGAVEVCGVGDGFFELGFADFPLAVEGAFFAVELVFEGDEGFDNGFELLAEFCAAEVLVELLGFVGSGGVLEAKGVCGDEAVAKCSGESGGEVGGADPDALVLGDG